MKTADVVFANEVHQLLVTVSQHLHLLKNGVLQYQEKSLEVNISNFHLSRKEHLVYYVLRDLFSGNFVFAVGTTKRLLPLADFLHFGWGRDGGEDHFWGLPRKLSLPKRISSTELLGGLERVGVEPFHPSSGFTSGIHIIKGLEDNLCYYVLDRSAIHSLDSIQRRKDLIYRYMLEDRSGGESRDERWRNNLPPEAPRAEPGYLRYRALFPIPRPSNPALPLFGTAARKPAPMAEPRPLAFLNSPIENSKFSEEKLAQAGELLYAAYDAGSGDARLHTVYRALRRSPYCADAYNLLAHESTYHDERVALYRRAVRAGELTLGELFFRRNEGHFWEDPKTRPYMRALRGLADTLWKTGPREEALEIYREMLRLDRNDHQGNRYLLGFRLLEMGRYREMEELYRDYGEDTCFMLYNLALSRFCNRATDADQVLRQARKANRHVPAYLLGEARMPYRLPDRYSHGSKEEAMIYAGEAAAAWREAAGALDWLQK